MDKLRACIVANYYANAGITKLPEVNSLSAASCFKEVVLYCTVALTTISSVSQHASKSDPAVLNHPAIRRFLESPSRSSSPLNQGSETPSLAHSESESLSQQGEGAERDGEGAWREDGSRHERRPGRNTGKVSSSDKVCSSVIGINTASFFIFYQACNAPRHLLQDTFGVPLSLGAEQRVTYHTTGNEASRLYAKKTIVVGNVSRYVTK